MTLSKLSLRNAKRQTGDYLVYFVTVTITAALLYACNGLIFSPEILKLSTLMKSLPVTIVLASIVVVCIMGWLVQYTTGFMFTKRSREFGTYILIGLENRQVARLFFLENLIVGAFALLFGILLGNLVFQALRAILLALFGIPYTFAFTFSFRAVALTLFYFVLIYLSAQLRSRRRIRSMKIYDLIYFDRLNENAALAKSGRRKKIFSASIVFGVAGTLLLLTRSLPTGILGAACIIVFLYGFFLSFSSGVPAWFDRRPGRKYQGQTLLIFRTLSAKLNTMGIVMATIALLFTAVLISQGTGLIFGAIFESRQTAETCFDIFIGTETPAQDGSDLIAYIESSIPVTAAHSYSIYQGTDARITDYLNENTDYYPCYPYDTWMKFSDYAALRSMLGYPDAALEPGEYLIHCVPWQKDAVTACAKPIAIGGATLQPGSVHTETLNQRLWNVNGTDFILILPDEAALSRPVSHNLYAAMTKEPVSEEQYATLCRIRDDRELYSHITLYTAPQVQAEYASSTAMLVLPLYYLALVLIMTAATILTIQQLSETDRYRRQFLLLKKLGMDRQEMHRALRLQFMIYYTMPAIPPLFVSIPFLLNLCNATDPGVT
ncbi:MAG: ABC transporter permease, partial [Lachnospiraceae bacterium]|nr:ABC transporter permease [Lachnospiraceae bacterium]